MLGQCQHANNDVLPTTTTITKRWPSDCLLSGELQALIFVLVYLLSNSLLSPGLERFKDE